MATPSSPTKEDKATFGNWLREMRKTRGLSQEEAAKRAGIVRQQWLRIESGESGTRRETVPGIAFALGLPESEVFQRAGFAFMETPEPDVALGERLGRHLRRLHAFGAAGAYRALADGAVRFLYSA